LHAGTIINCSQKKGAHLLLGHHLDKLVVVDLAITVGVSFTDHLIDFFVGELFAEVGHDVTKFGGGDETIAVLVKDSECFSDFFLGVGGLHLSCHHGKEFWEVNGAVAISVNLVDHVLEFSFGGVLAEGSHDGSEFLGGDGTIAVLVEQGEGLLEFGNLFQRASQKANVKVRQPKLSQRSIWIAGDCTHLGHVVRVAEASPLLCTNIRDARC